MVCYCLLWSVFLFMCFLDVMLVLNEYLVFLEYMLKFKSYVVVLVDLLMVGSIFEFGIVMVNVIVGG